MKLDQLIEQLKKKAEQLSDVNRLQDKTYFLDNDHILTFPRLDGESRYPYGTDGFNFWTCSSGYMYANESTYNAFEFVQEGMEPNIAFFAGMENGNGTYEIVPLLGVPVNLEVYAKRYVIHTPKAAYYFTYYKGLEFCVRVFVDEDNLIYFTIHAVNKTAKPVRMYLSTYMEPTLLYGDNCDPNVRWWREGGIEKETVNSLPGFVFKMTQDMSRTVKICNFGIINRTTQVILDCTELTASRRQYMGGKNNGLSSSVALKYGTFGEPVTYCTFTDMAAFGDLNYFTLTPEEPARFDLSFAFTHEEEAMKQLKMQKIIPSVLDEKLKMLTEQEKIMHDRMKLTVGEFRNAKIHKEVFNSFFGFVQRQVEYCALGKSYAGPYLGFRDVAQQIEGALLWQTKKCADKIVEVLSFIDPSGRCPRLFSYPAAEEMPVMNLNLYIDQGVWMISTVITYLKFTGDFSILDRKCGYYEITDAKAWMVRKTDYQETVLCHIIKIMDFLISMRDFEETGCVRAMFGDWNDALDGLGVPQDPKEEFGSGVSVMASLQVFQNTNEMVELLNILDKDKFSDKIAQYQKANQEIREGLLKYAIVENELGEKKILHGWGDKRSYTVGGFADVDKKSRVGLTSYAFWVLSGMYDPDPSMKTTILKAFEALDSKYGLRTFDQPFDPDAKGVGRIVNLPAGTAENAANYIHATMFGISALLRMGCAKEALLQLEKALPITHSAISATPFIMANSYCFNTDKNIDGQSMNDWHTGSGTVLLKLIVKYIIGFDPCFGGVAIHPCSELPVNSYTFTIDYRSCLTQINYNNEGNGKRSFSVNGNKREASHNSIMNTETLWISQEEFIADGKIIIQIID